MSARATCSQSHRYNPLWLFVFTRGYILTHMHRRITELWYFFLANLRASAFGIFLLSIFLFTSVVDIPVVSRFDFIFLSAVTYQMVILLLGFERLREFFVIILFHLLATAMELFKTHPSVGSWEYLIDDHTIFALATVPLFTGFLYSAVGSYISRAFKFLNLSYEHFPAYHHLWILSVLIYLNFFTHHYVFDIRYILLIYTLVIFWRTTVRFCVYKKRTQDAVFTHRRSHCVLCVDGRKYWNPHKRMALPKPTYILADSFLSESRLVVPSTYLKLCTCLDHL
jgi:uncharacterized membrane protein YoaT (DUF817 family)